MGKTRTTRPRTRMRSRPARILLAAALALLGHGAVGVFLSVSGALASLMPAALPPMVEGLDARQAASDEPLTVESLVDELDRPVTPSQQERKVEKEINEKDAKGQVVDIARPAIEQRPDEAKFAAEYDSTVKNETKGPSGLSKAGAVVPGAVATPKSEAATPPLPAGATAKTPAPTALALRGPVGTRIPGPAGPQSPVRELGPDGDQPHQSGQGEVRPPEVAGGGALPGGAPRVNLAPSAALLQQALGEGAGSPDYLHDLDDGEAIVEVFPEFAPQHHGFEVALVLVQHALGRHHVPLVQALEQMMLHHAVEVLHRDGLLQRRQQLLFFHSLLFPKVLEA